MVTSTQPTKILWSKVPARLQLEYDQTLLTKERVNDLRYEPNQEINGYYYIDKNGMPIVSSVRGYHINLENWDDLNTFEKHATTNYIWGLVDGFGYKSPHVCLAVVKYLQMIGGKND